jgi:hypothetical protein
MVDGTADGIHSMRITPQDSIIGRNTFQRPKD